MSTFLENLKKSVDSGDFNSEAAKKITEINERTKEIESQDVTYDELSERVNERLEASGGLKIVSEEEALQANSVYEETMSKIKEEERAMKVIATLTDIEQIVVDTILDMFVYIKDIEGEFDVSKPINDNLFELIEKIKVKYISLNP